MNQLGFPILSLILLVPVLGAFGCLFAPGDEAARANAARRIALAATLVDFAWCCG